MKILRPLIMLALILALGSGPLQAAEGKVYKRIISLYAAHTEMFLRLGARDSLVGISRNESYAGPETEGWVRPPVFSIHDDTEKFLAAKPDLVLVRPQHLAAGSHLMTALKNAGVEVRAAQVLAAAELYEYWRNLAKLVGREAEVEKIIEDFNRRISVYYEAASRVPEEDKPGVFIEAVHGQVKTFLPDSIPIWLVELAGGRNAAADATAHAPGLIVANYGPERLLAKANEVDIFISQGGAMNSADIEQVKKRPIYRPLKAFKEGRVYKIPEEILARPTPSLLLGLAQIAQWTGLEAKIQNPPAADEELKADLPPEQKTN